MKDNYQRGWNPKDIEGSQKAPLRLIPPAGLVEVSRVMRHGAEKYGAYNWREHPVRYCVYVEAALRHLYAAMDGEDMDRDSGCLHLANVASCMLILLDAIACGTFVDDRPAIRGKAGFLLKSTRVDPVTPKPPKRIEEIVEVVSLARDYPYNSRAVTPNSPLTDNEVEDLYPHDAPGVPGDFGGITAAPAARRLP